MLLICLFDIYRSVARDFSLLFLLISFSFFFFSQQLHRCPALIERSVKGALLQWSQPLISMVRVFRPRIHFGVTLNFENLISVVLSKFPFLFLCQCQCFLLFQFFREPFLAHQNCLRQFVVMNLALVWESSYMFPVSVFISLALFFGQITQPHGTSNFFFIYMYFFHQLY